LRCVVRNIGNVEASRSVGGQRATCIAGINNTARSDRGKDQVACRASQLCKSVANQDASREQEHSKFFQGYSNNVLTNSTIARPEAFEQSCQPSQFNFKLILLQEMEPMRLAM
jgi:hypothetical protein